MQCRKIAMTDNDKLETENTFIIEGLDTDTEGDDDIHFCKKCKLMFMSLEDYLQHKVKHDNFKVTLSRTKDHKLLVPRLVQKTEKGLSHIKAKDAAEKENRRRGRKKKKAVLEEVNKDLITERQSYWCPKCNVKFNREATLRRHIEWIHNNDGDFTKVEEGDSEEEDIKPNLGHQEKGDQQAVPGDSRQQGGVRQQTGGQQEEDERQKGEVPTGAKGTHIIIVKESQDQGQGSEDLDPTFEISKEDFDENAERPYICQLCGNRFKEIYVLKAHMLTHSNRRDFVCTYEGCSYAFKTKGALKRHIRRHTGERPFPCEQCGRSFTESGALTRHLKSRIPCKNKADHELPRYGKRWSLSTGAENNMKMADCSQGTSGPNTAIGLAVAVDTELDHNQMETECAVAEVIANSDNIVIEDAVGNIEDVVAMETQEILAAKEFLENHEILAPTQCKVCKEDFLSFDVLKIHLRTHLADVPFKCSLCHFVAEKRDQLSNHMISLHKDQLRGSELLTHIPISTDFSNTDDKEEQSRIAKIAVKQLLEIPSTSAEDLEPPTHNQKILFKCPVCTRSFRNSNYLRLHMKIHTGNEKCWSDQTCTDDAPGDEHQNAGDRPHKCPECDKTFILKDSLTKHLSTHSEYRNYKCGTCGKLFKRISHVREHLKIHSADRPFSCSVCNKAFKTNNAMKVHLRTHTSILPYVCTFCRRRFREKGSLQRHQRMHTGERPYQCKHCKRCFAEHGTLNRHLKAKVPCTRQLQIVREEERSTERDSSEEMTVLAEFSSVVADTQQYMVSEEDNNSLGVQVEENETTTEYVVVQDGELNMDDLQNVKIVTEGEVDGSLLEGVQVTDLDSVEITQDGVQITEEYVLVTDDAENVKIVDSRTGETLATMLTLSSMAEGDSQVVTLPTQDNGITAVAMAPTGSVEMETIEEAAGGMSDTEYQIETVVLPSHNEIEAVAMAPHAELRDLSQNPSENDT